MDGSSEGSTALDSGVVRGAAGPVANRRQFLQGSLAGGLVALAAGCAPARSDPGTPAPASGAGSAFEGATWPDARDPVDFIDHGLQPITIETRRAALGMSVVTPISRFFIRNNLPLPPASIVRRPDDWAIQIDGVASPRSFTLADLKAMPVETIGMVVQCSGNGRIFFSHAASGSQWEVGAAGCALWTGIRVGALVAALGGPVPGARFMTTRGAEEAPEGVDPLSVIMERSVPMEKGMEDAMLVWEMNGLPIPLYHGGPLRLIVPGYYGVNHVKYATRLAFTAQESQAAIMRTGYRSRPIGVAGAPDQPSMWEMNVKSWLNGPGANDAPVARGRRLFHGVAFSGRGPVSRVEYSVDGGTSWRPAEFYGPDLGPFAWRTFRFELELSPGTVTVATRATDATGAVQPPDRVENERAYGHNGWRDHALAVRVVEFLPREAAAGGGVGAADVAPGAAPAPAGGRELGPEAARGRSALLDQTDPSCGLCHTLSDAGATGRLGPNLDQMGASEERIIAAVTNGLGTMPSYGESLTPTTIRDIARYIVEVTR
jgi:DMSO/TMAO reductase YedYZ molybdopterin-dependent catalytic subunit/mono/diheme cytochrome c family protein